MKENAYFTLGSAMLIFLLFIMFIAPFFPFIDSNLNGERIHFSETGEISKAPFPPSKEFPIGSDKEGRDLLSLIIMGARETIFIVLSITTIRILLATVLALLSYKNKGPIYRILEVWNRLFATLPIIFAAILLMNLPFLFFNPNRQFWAILILAIIEVGKVGYIIQQKVYSISKTTYVEAGVTLGTSPFKMFLSYYLPNLIPDIIINFFIDLGRVMLLIGQLGILKVFISQEIVQPDAGSVEIWNTSINWATLLGESGKEIITSPWIPFFPAIVIMYAIMTFNIFGEGLRKRFYKAY